MADVRQLYADRIQPHREIGDTLQSLLFILLNLSATCTIPAAGQALITECYSLLTSTATDHESSNHASDTIDLLIAFDRAYQDDTTLDTHIVPLLCQAYPRWTSEPELVIKFILGVLQYRLSHDGLPQHDIINLPLDLRSLETSTRLILLDIASHYVQEVYARQDDNHYNFHSGLRLLSLVISLSH